MKKLKVIQVGIGHDHAFAPYSSFLRQSDVFDLIGIVLCDGEKERFGEAVEKYSAAPIITLEDALAIEDLDAVAVECEDFDLTRYTMIFAERGVHIHMDKPGGINQADYEKMLSVMKRKNLVFQTGYMYRFNPVIDETLKAIKNGEFGKIYSVEAHMDCLHNKEKREWLGAYPGGMMYYLGCHLIDLIVQIQGIPTEIIPLSCSTG